MGATATPVIMSRSPTGGWQEGRGGHNLCCGSWSPWKPLGSHRGRWGWGLGWRSPLPALPGLQAAAGGHGAKQQPRVPWQDGRPAGCGVSPCFSRNPHPNGAVPERQPRIALFLYFHGEFVSLLN